MTLCSVSNINGFYITRLQNVNNTKLNSNFIYIKSNSWYYYSGIIV